MRKVRNTLNWQTQSVDSRSADRLTVLVALWRNTVFFDGFCLVPFFCLLSIQVASFRIRNLANPVS